MLTSKEEEEIYELEGATSDVKTTIGEVRFIGSR